MSLSLRCCSLCIYTGDYRRLQESGAPLVAFRADSAPNKLEVIYRPLLHHRAKLQYIQQQTNNNNITPGYITPPPSQPASQPASHIATTSPPLLERRGGDIAPRRHEQQAPAGNVVLLPRQLLQVPVDVDEPPAEVRGVRRREVHCYAAGKGDYIGRKEEGGGGASVLLLHSSWLSVPHAYIPNGFVGG